MSITFVCVVVWISMNVGVVIGLAVASTFNRNCQNKAPLNNYPIVNLSRTEWKRVYNVQDW